jgi:hypothetical protein
LLRIPALMLLLFAVSCSGTHDLTSSEREKLTPALIALLTEESAPDELYDVTLRTDGTKEYGIIIRSTNPDELRAHGINVQSAIADVVTARVTKDQLRSLLALPSVRSVDQGSKNQIQH